MFLFPPLLFLSRGSRQASQGGEGGGLTWGGGAVGDGIGEGEGGVMLKQRWADLL